MKRVPAEDYIAYEIKAFHAVAVDNGAGGRTISSLLSPKTLQCRFRFVF